MRVSKHLPNAITLVRLACAPAVVALIATENVAPAFWVFVGAGLSDAVDGALARLTRSQSALGSYLDALADKVLLVALYVSLAAIGMMAPWLALMVVCRDLGLVGCFVYDWVHGVRRTVHPLMISKINTAAQIVLVAEVLAHWGFGVFPAFWTKPLVALVAATTLVSAIAYGAARWRNRWRQGS